MVRVPHLSQVAVALVAMSVAAARSRRRLAAADARIAALETETARLSEEARRAERVKDDFLATLSHELRTPLNAMLGWVQLLRLHSDNKAMRDHAIEIVERSARAQVQVVSDMLDVSRIIAGQLQLAFKPVNLAAVVRAGTEAVGETAAAKNVTMEVELEPVEGEVIGDHARLQQVVWNLAINAVKFTLPGGRVKVALRQEEWTAAIVVTDTGVGIAPDILPFVFDRFTQGDSSLTRPFGGTGLGLAIVRHLVELHGGSVEGASEGRNRGASFTVRLPLRAAQS
jgi:signal transduction histidine kinase